MKESRTMLFFKKFIIFFVLQICLLFLFSCTDPSIKKDSENDDGTSWNGSLYPFYDLVDIVEGTAVRASEAKIDINGANVWIYYSDSACTKSLSSEAIKSLSDNDIVYKFSVAVTGAIAKADESDTTYYMDSDCTLKAIISDTTGDNEVFYKKTLTTKAAISVYALKPGVTENSAHSYSINSKLESVIFRYNGSISYDYLKLLVKKGETVIVSNGLFAPNRTYTLSTKSFLEGKYTTVVYAKYKEYTYSYPIILEVEDSI